MKLSSEKGFTLVELMVAVGLSGVVAIALFAVLRFADKETKYLTEDIQSTILKFGATKVIQKDLSNSNPSFNYLEINDNKNIPFMILAHNEYCAQNCSRELTLEIPVGEVRSSKVLYLLVVKGLPGEMVKFSIDPENTFDQTTNKYKYLNGRDIDPNYSISHTQRAYSPWIAGRMILLSSESDYYDCLSGVLGATASNCPLTAKNASDGNYATKRPFKMLGIVSSDEKDLEFHEVAMHPELLRKDYITCRAEKNMNCLPSSKHNLSAASGLITTKNFFENLPIFPGQDNSAYIQPVEFVRYHLERPTPNSHDKNILLMRSTASFNGTKLSFDRAHSLMGGVKSLVFTRKNVSNSVIEFKIIEAN